MAFICFKLAENTAQISSLSVSTMYIKMAELLLAVRLFILIVAVYTMRSSFTLVLSAALAALGVFADRGYLVELNSKETFDSFYARLTSDGVTASPKLNITSPIFTGLSFQFLSKVPVEYNLPTDYLSSLSSVINFWPIDVVSTKNNETVSTSPSGKSKRSQYQRRDSTTTSSSVPLISGSPWSAVHNMTGVNDVHAKGITGSNVVIAVLDSGIDYNHPALGGGFGAGFKVKGGYDFIGSNPTYASGYKPDNDPMDEVGHGTEAAGVAAGKSSQYLGVAPDAKILAYRIFQQDTNIYLTNDVVISAMTRAYDDGADVISLSLGGGFPYKSNPIGVVADRLVDNGVIVSIAAGNSGRLGTYYASYGGGGGSSVAVGAVENTYVTTWPAVANTTSGVSQEFAYLSTNGSNFPLTGNFQADYISISACSVTSSDRPSSNSSVLFITRDTACTDAVQFDNVKNLGYKYAFLVNGPSNTMLYSFTVTYTSTLLAGAFVDNSFASWLSSNVGGGKTFTISLNTDNPPRSIISTFAGSSLPNRISMWGPTDENYFFPSISTPAGNVLAPALGGGYIVVSGTSFAAPYLAGCAALYLNSRGISRSLGNSYTGIAAEFNSKLISTATTLDLYDGSQHVTGVQAPLIQQGAGLVNAVKLTQYSVSLLSSPYISLNDTQFRSAIQKIKIKNSSNKRLTYSAKHIPGTTVTAISNGVPNTYFPPYNTDSTASIVMTPSTWVLTPGGSTTIYAYFSLPAKTSDSVVYEGKIQITVSNGEVISVPYMGVQQVTSNISPISGSSMPILRVTSSGLTAQTAPISSFNYGNGDYPYLSPTLTYGTTEFSVDIVNPAYSISNDFTPDPVKGSRNFVGFAGAPDDDTGPLEFPQYFIGRIPAGLTFPVMTFTDGSTIPAGSYKFLVRALKPFSNRNKKSSWQFFLTDTVTIAH